MALVKEVILCPGLTGSHLTGPPLGRFLTRTIWPSPSSLVVGGLAAMRLPVPGEDDGPWFGNPLFPGKPIYAYYGHLITALERAGWTVVYPSGDWRQQVTEDARRLAEMIRKRGGDHPLYFVVHSRGGLVLRKAFELLDAAELEDRGVRVVALGVPHQGSLNAVEALFGQDQLARQLLALGRCFPGAVSRALGLETIGRIIRSWPAVYELLPAPGSSWMTTGNPSDLYNPAVYADSPLNPVPGYLTLAKAFWAGLRPVPSFVEWFDIVGDRCQTWCGVPNVKTLSTPKSMDVSRDGDGTVHMHSAAHGEFATVYTPTAHDALPLDGRLFQYITAFLQSGTKERYTLGGRVLQFGFLQLHPKGIH